MPLYIFVKTEFTIRLVPLHKCDITQKCNEATDEISLTVEKKTTKFIIISFFLSYITGIRYRNLTKKI